jgi:hypothetical protein
MRTNVTFRHPAEFITSDDSDGILAANGAGWFKDLLLRIDGLVVHSEPIQEDWGVVFFADRDDCRFWIGLSFWDEGAWIAHVHHHSTAWMQRFTARGKAALARLATDIHVALETETSVSDINWYLEAEIAKPDPKGAATPDAA